MLVDIEFLGILQDLLLVLHKQADPKSAEISYSLFADGSIEAMIKQHYLMPLIVICFPNKQITRVSIAMNEPMPEYHSRKDLDQIQPDLARVNPQFLNLALAVYPSPACKLHHNKPLRAKLRVIVWDVNVRVIFEILLRSKSVLQLNTEI